MTFQKQLRWGGLLIILASLMMNGMNIVMYLGYRDALIQATYGIGFTGLILSATIIHIAQAHRVGIFGLFAYLITLLSLVYANIFTFLTLAEFSGIEEAHRTFLDLRNPVMSIAVYGVFVGWILLGTSVAQVGVLPRLAGVLVALGVALQLPTQYAMEKAVPLFFMLAIGGSILVGSGLIGIGWSLWSGRGWDQQELGLSDLDRKWGGPLIIFSGLMFAVDAMANMLGGLSLASGITHVISYTTCILISFLLYASHGKHVSWAGFAAFLFTQVGAALYMITALLILAQLAGTIDNNRAMMASWVDIPVGRYGGHMVTIGIFLFGWESIRSRVFTSWSGWLVLIGIALALPFAFTIQAYFLGIFWVIGAILEGIGVGWMGWTILSRKRAETNTQFAESTA